MTASISCCKALSDYPKPSNYSNKIQMYCILIDPILKMLVLLTMQIYQKSTTTSQGINSLNWVLSQISAYLESKR